MRSTLRKAHGAAVGPYRGAAGFSGSMAIPPAVNRLIILINNTTAVGSVDGFIRRHLQSAHAILRAPLTDLSIAMVGDRRMAALHQQFLGIAGPTDVLTFPLDLDNKGRPLSGEVVICVPEARRRCKEIGGKLREELLLYALHGLLHLCGFDDRTDREYRRMHRKEDEILDQLGVGRVFQRD